MAYARAVAVSGVSADETDAELVSIVVNGNDTAFEFIMRRYNRLLFRTARSIVTSDAEAEDVLQEAYLRAWRALGDFRADAKLSTWLVRIVVNEALGRRRRKTAQVIPLDGEIGSGHPGIQASLMANSDLYPDRQAMRSELRAILEARIDRLPDNYRSVFVLRAVEELTTSEVAQVLQLPEATVRTRYFRARSLLREGLASDIDASLVDAFSFDGERCDRIVRIVLAQLTGIDATSDVRNF
ncbi:MAG TPA: RNA polymerase sigma factor [Burkholderiaceae bacterium]|nr:RNA polymerase sigma factor [Burkholderiaceae bacterium]